VVSLHELSAVELSRLVRAGQTDPVEVVVHHLARVERLSDVIGAFVTVTADRALEEATALSARISAARRDATVAELGPLVGVPTGIKDLQCTAGVRTMFGSAAYADFIPDADDASVSRLRRAGLISLGKTNTPEFGLPCYTESAVAPPARTPWDPERSAGGSSGGSAAAVAAGMVPLAHGSDGGGSLRIPASACGLVGFKPSRGRVSAAPLGGDPAGLAQQGPLARTVADAAALLDVLAGYETGDPYWAPPLPAGRTFLAAAGRDPGPLRIARVLRPMPSGVEPHADCVLAVERASQLLAGLGHEIVEMDQPVPSSAMEAFLVVWAVGAGVFPVPAGTADRLTALTVFWRDRAAAVSAVEYATALGTMQRYARAALLAYASVDAVLTPTLALPPVPVGWFDSDGPAADLRRQLEFTPYTSLWNVTGQPAVSLPLGWTGDGLPIGVMLAGRPGGDAELLSLAGQIERAGGWDARRPGIW
jgi:amidase